MAGGRYDSSLTRVRPFFGALIRRDASGGSWLGKLLAAAPNAAILDTTLRSPGTLLPALAQPTDRGHLACFEYPVPPPRSLLEWFIENPGALVWPKGQVFSNPTTTLRRALIDDSPPGSRPEAQAMARDLLASSSTSGQAWWRFEGTSKLDCVLLTDRLVITVEGKRTEALSPATDWYPERSQLVRNLEAAKHLSQGRAWASLLISETLIAEGSDAALERILPASAPHLTPSERDELHARYLGSITWKGACDATGLDPELLPESSDDL